eukprot:7186944-Alexandrium_andersonii.AAC.1
MLKARGNNAQLAFSYSPARRRGPMGGHERLEKRGWQWPSACYGGGGGWRSRNSGWQKPRSDAT